MSLHGPRFVVLVALQLSLAAGCANNTPPPAAPTVPAPPSPDAAGASKEDALLAPFLRGLDMTPVQRGEVLRAGVDIDGAAHSFVGSALEFGHSIAGAVRTCQVDTRFIGAESESMLREGEALRAVVLDSVQRAHRALTPAQRKVVSERLVEGVQSAKGERTKSAKRTREIAPKLDLSTMQILQLLMKAASLWSTYSDKLDPWREKYHQAVLDFARDDFDVHKEPVAEAPIFKIGLEFVHDGLRALVPLLEPPQCKVLGQMIDDGMNESAERFEAQSKKRAEALRRGEEP